MNSGDWNEFPVVVFEECTDPNGLHWTVFVARKYARIAEPGAYVQDETREQIVQFLRQLCWVLTPRRFRTWRVVAVQRRREEVTGFWGASIDREFPSLSEAMEFSNKAIEEIGGNVRGDRGTSTC